MPSSPFALRLASALILSLSITACGLMGPGGGAGGTLKVECGGKCDGFDTIHSLLRDPKNLNVDDLVALGDPYATDAVNSLLASTPFASLSIKPTRTFDAGALDQLVTDLAKRFGDSQLTTEVDALRKQHLASSADSVYAEAAFDVTGSLQHQFKFPVPWSDSGTATVGFDGTTPIEARVVSAFPSATSAVVNAPLAAAKQIRGFVLPRSLDDIRAMKPGESIALDAHGQIAVNLGAGVPLLVANPLTWASYTLVFSAALRTRLDGDLDVQLVRLGGGKVVVDVGIEKAHVASEEVAVHDRWGAQGLASASTDVAGFHVDLGKLAKRAIDSQLNRRLDFLDARWQHSHLALRQSVARLTFDLDRGDPTLLSAAIAQAMRGDVRLGQALSDRGEPGVVADFDLLRSGTSSTSFAGIDLLGLSFFQKAVQNNGSVVIQTPGGARTILFDSLHKSSGWFISSHGYTRVALSGLVFPADPSRNPRSEANLFLQLEDSDKAMERDKLLDNLDGLILALGGQPALSAIEHSGNQLERLVETQCAGHDQAYDSCPIDMLSDSDAVALRQQALQEYDDAIANLPAQVRDFAHQVGNLRLLAQSVYEQKAQFTGPGTSIVVDDRLDDGALAALMQPGAGERFASAAGDYLAAAGITRTDDAATIASERSRIEDRTADERAKMAKLVDDDAGRYRKLANVEQAAIESLGPIGARAITIDFPVDADNRPVYEHATAASMVQRRARLAASMVDGLIADAGAFGPNPEQTVTYGLLGVTAPARLDLRLDLHMNVDDTVLFWRKPYRVAGYPTKLDLYRRGDEVAPIDGGLFNVDALTNLKE